MEPLEKRIGAARAMLIAGPTASGKSTLALRIAERLAQRGRPAWVVNADAMQVYDGLRVVTARPPSEQVKRVPHRLYGHVSADIRYSVGAWLRDADAVLVDARAAGAFPIFVGGTGLYFNALVQGLAATPDIPPAIRSRLKAMLDEGGADALRERLRQLDPRGGAVSHRDPQRVLRDLEVIEATGRPLREWQRQPEPPLLVSSETARFVVLPTRDDLYRRIDARFDHMLKEGALEEVEALLRRDLDPSLPAMKAIGVRQLAAALRGEMSLADAVTRAKTETRRYAKRQITWFRHQMPDWQLLDG